MSRQSKKARKRAGGNWTGRSKYGQHTLQRWKSGSNWVECQRCGFDVYEEDSSRQWDGLIVCDGCKDSRHPQDFVRGRKDSTAPTGLSTGSTDYDSTEVSGSTSVPGGTFGDYLGEEITNPESPPWEVATDEEWYLWLDFNDTDHMWADTGSSVPITNGTQIFRMDNKAINTITPGGPDPSWVTNSYRPETPEANYAPTYRSNQRNGRGVGDFDVDIVTGAGATIEADAIGTASHPVFANGIEQHVTGCTVIVVAEMPNGDAVSNRWLFGGTNDNLHDYGMQPNGSGNVPIFRSRRFIPSYADATEGVGSLSTHVGEWFCFWVEFKGTAQEIYYNNATSVVPFSTRGHDCDTQPYWSNRYGSTSTSSPSVAGGWDSNIGEVLVFSKIFTAAERTALYNWLKSRWGLSAVKTP